MWKEYQISTLIASLLRNLFLSHLTRLYIQTFDLSMKDRKWQEKLNSLFNGDPESRRSGLFEAPLSLLFTKLWSIHHTGLKIKWKKKRKKKMPW